MGVNMDSAGNKLSEPVNMDTTSVGLLADTRIYTTVMSEDKHRILVYKIHKKDNKYNLVTLLFNDSLQLLRKSRLPLELDERRNIYSDLQVDNDGDLVFTESTKGSNRDFFNKLQLVTKPALSDSFQFTKIDLEDKYIDEVQIKIDNLNKKYILNTFYYKNNRGSILGLCTSKWDKPTNTSSPVFFTAFDDDLRNQARRDGQLKFAFDDFFIRNIVVKKDGGFILTAEDYTSQTRGNNNWNRWDYLFNSPFYNNNYYLNNPSYYNYYRPGNYQASQQVRYYYDNILVISIDKNGTGTWSAVIQKEQFDDYADNFLSYSTLVNGGEIHFLFNDTRNNQIINDHSVNSKGEVKRNPTLKSQEKGYQFMARYAKQTGPSQLLVPCDYRGYICFAKIDF
jgi:hypothetical protein